MNVRQNAELLAASDVAALTTAFSRMQTTADNRGYAHLAGLHGWPAGLCKHHQALFLPWHRAYLYMFELSLRDLGGDVRLVWWDWTSERSHRDGLPAIFTGEAALRSAEMPLDDDLARRVRDEAPYLADLSGPVPRTVRQPDPADSLPSRRDVDDVLDAPTFADFTTRLEDIHDRVHDWFKGTMSAVVLAGFDPAFWTHHAMIDRLWCLWQLRHPNAGVSPLRTDQALEGFPLTVGQVLDVRTLGYDYASEAIS